MTRLYVIPCSGKKLPHPAPAGELYVGSWHQFARAAADAMAAREPGEVVVLSALHGLLPLTEVVEPYDVKLSDLTRSPRPGELDRFPRGEHPLINSVAAELARRGVTQTVELLPTSYAHITACAVIGARLHHGAGNIRRWWPLEGCAGVGYQRQVLGQLRDDTYVRDEL